MSAARILGLIPVLAASAYAVSTYHQISEVPRRDIVDSDTIFASFRKSCAVQLVDLRGHARNKDSYMTIIHVPEHRSDISDKQALAWFFNGFFGSLVSGPERTVLQMLRVKTFTKFSSRFLFVHSWIWSVVKLQCILANQSQTYRRRRR